MSRIAYLTSIDFGPGTLANLADALRELAVRRPLLVADKGVLAAGLVAKASANLPVGTPLFLDTPPNPTESAVKAALAMYRAEGCDGIVALGGGSLTTQVRVNPGDWLFGDMDGVVVIPVKIVDEVLRKAEAMGGVEDQAREEIKNGADVTTVFEKYGRL